MFGIRLVARAAFTTVLTVGLLSSHTANAQGVCNFLSGSQKTACQNAAATLAASKAAAAQAKAAANQAAAAKSATPDPNASPSQQTPPTGGATAKPNFGPDAPLMRPIEQKNTYRGGIEDCTGNNCTGVQAAAANPAQNGICAPGSYCSDGTISDRARKVLATHDITADDAIKCNSVYTVANVLESGPHPGAKNPAALAQITHVTSRELYLWDLIYVLSPAVKQAPPANRNSTMYRIRDHQIYDDMDKYQVDYQPLLDDYNACIAKGLPPSGL
jgi:hypothetical protein